MMALEQKVRTKSMKMKEYDKRIRFHFFFFYFWLVGSWWLLVEWLVVDGGGGCIIILLRILFLVEHDPLFLNFDIY